MGEGIGRRYQEETKYSRSQLGGHVLDWRNRPAASKTYPEAPRTVLPEPLRRGGSPLWDLQDSRRSVRAFDPSPIELAHLSQLLWSCQGLSGRVNGFDLRTAPSAGALYPVETYLSVQAVDGLQPGIFHYHVPGHALELLEAGDFRAAVSRSALDQGFAGEASVVFIWTAVFRRSVWKYRERAYRYVYLDAGHLAQNLALAAVALGLGSCQIAALFDDEVNSLVGADGTEESAIYMSAVGRPAAGARP
jgi:SagB-type dehydrogenase family enzyme